MTRLRLILACLLALLPASPALAWWEYGHATVAEIAYAAAKPETRRQIDALLRQSALLDTPTCPARTVAQASYWPDCVKELKDRFSYAYSWHYQNADICKPFDLAVPCKDGNCVSKQIERNARLLADQAVPVRERIMALNFLLHFVGDLHQPLHAGDHADLGGNQVKAAYGRIEGKRVNLHAVWDGYLADRALSTPPADAPGILSQVTPAERAAWAQGSVEDWSREEWQVARDAAYASAVADPCGPKSDRVARLDEATIAKLVPVLREQVAKGGIRLARLLDEALGPR
ncbi:S1/P1 nuclease [Sphingomonas jatrophae]|uniref:S1/P1 Nuclease n=1 Tax=Sphingomonas jatrophae TaxID=1166337 RepID=A0A1I6LRJ5_9SPHN|nr:S1/P1 nuclease [Sphingomonas jatrophae]SFS06115.1 S1/P1 Nuclease [Sphingomonas jatrophae]